MADLIAPALTAAVIILFVGAWIFYLRRVRQGRADPVVDPSLPTNLQPMPRYLHDPPTSMTPNTACTSIQKTLSSGIDKPESD